MHAESSSHDRLIDRRRSGRMRSLSACGRRAVFFMGDDHLNSCVISVRASRSHIRMIASIERGRGTVY